MAGPYKDVIDSMNSFLGKFGIEKAAADTRANRLANGVYKAAAALSKNESDSTPEAAINNVPAEKNTGVPAAVGGKKGAYKAGVMPGSTITTLSTEVNAMACSKPEVQKAASHARAQRLGHRILQTLAGVEKESSLIEKVAAQNPALAQNISASFDEFTHGYLRGLEKKAEDINELIKAGVTNDPKVAASILEKAASLDPESIMPEEYFEGMLQKKAEAEEQGILQMLDQMPPEQRDQLLQISKYLAEQGLSSEEIMQAAQQLEQLLQAGASPEEIVAASQQMTQEGQGAAEQEKMAAAQRVGAIKDFMRRAQTAG
jgi:hypothetical protein